MKSLLLLSSFFIIFSSAAQVPQIEWQICLGGTDVDDGYAVTQTTDGGYAVVGHTLSTNGNALGNHGGLDMLVVKLNSAGQVEWQKCYGGSGEDDGRSIAQTPDGGLIVGGHTYSNDGDVSGYHGSSDSWIVKLDAVGNIEWQKCYGGSYGEGQPTIVKVTTDGGYVFVTNTSSIDGDVNPPSLYYSDYWLVKLNAAGTIEWQNVFDAGSSDIPYDLKETEDGGFVMAGTKHAGPATYWWIVKAGSSGTFQWEKTYAQGLPAEQAEGIEVVPGIGYVVVGSIASGPHDGWVLLIDSAGNEIWDRTLSGSWEDVAVSVNLNDDGNYTILAHTSSQNGDITCNSEASDKFWWLILDSTGTTILNQFCFGGSGGDNPNMIIPTGDNGYICVGGTSSSDGDVSGNHGSIDFWVVKLGYNVGVEENENVDASIFPNPVCTTFHLRVSTPGFLLQLFDIDGRKIVERVFTNTNEADVNVSNLPPGIYPLQVIAGNGERYWQKVVVGK